MNKLYFIAELGQNHQGSLEIAKQMIDSLVGSGVNAVKTAKRDIETCLTEEQKKMPYDNPNSFGKTYYEHRKALELSKEDFHKMKIHAENKGFDFISSFTDKNSYDYLNEIAVTGMKIASQRIADIELLDHVAKNWKAKKLYMSSGMSNLCDIDKMLITFKDIPEKYLMQCSSIYPCENKDLNLNVLKTYKKYFSQDVSGFGFSGHHAGIAPDIYAYMQGAYIIERHYTLNRSWKGTDHAGSLGIDGVKKIIKYINEVEESKGSYEKKVLDGELSAIEKLRGDLK